MVVMTVVYAAPDPRPSHASRTLVSPCSQITESTARSSEPRLFSTICCDDLNPQNRNGRRITAEGRASPIGMSMRPWASGAGPDTEGAGRFAEGAGRFAEGAGAFVAGAGPWGGGPGGSLGVPGAALGVLGASLGVLGASLRVLGASLRVLALR